MDYIWVFDSGRAGPVVMVNALTHGNEICGAHAVKTLLHNAVRPHAGKLVLSFANPLAYEDCCASDPSKGRYLDRDLNRVWDDRVLNGPGDDRELSRARALRPFVDMADYLLDIHSMTLAGPAIMLSGETMRARELAAQLRVTDYIVADAGHGSGVRMRDRGDFSSADSAKTALLIECGQHRDKRSVAIAHLAAARFLRHFGYNIDMNELEAAGQTADAAPRTGSDAGRDTPFVRITEAVTAETKTFEYLHVMRALHVIPRAGTLIARDGDREIRTPYANCVALMPSKRPKPGQTAVRLGHFAP